MADKGKSRVSKKRGNYNEYLRKENPFDCIPRSTKRLLVLKDATKQTAHDGVPEFGGPSMTESFNEATLDYEDGSHIPVGMVGGNRFPTSTDLNISTDGFTKFGDPLVTASPNENRPDSDQNPYIHTDADLDNMSATRDDSEAEINDVTFELERELYSQFHDVVLPGVELDENDANMTDVPKASKDEFGSDLKGAEKIFEGSNLSLGASLLLIITYAMKYSLTGEGLNDLIRLIELHCPSVNRIPLTLGKFKKWFEDIKHPLTFHKFCSVCKILLDKSDFEHGVCPNDRCKNRLGIRDEAVSHFIEIPIQEQVKSLFTRPGFFNDINHRFTRHKKNPTAYEDIYDGEIYKKLSAPGGFLSDPHNISLLWNTDGIPCFKSSKMSIWPLFFQINELPYYKRVSPDYMILGGLWFGQSKPAIMSFTKPFIECLQNLESNGVEVCMPNNETSQCRVAVIGGTADLPARSLACNTIQFNGKYGCAKCLQPGETFKTGKRGHCHIFPFQPENPCGPLRTVDGFCQDIETATVTGVTTHGVKGPTFLQCLTYYNLVAGTCIDYMHGILLGVTKLLTKLWFSTEHSKESFSISSFVDVVDKRLCRIKPPNNITRCPRSIKDHIKYWKATELRSWLLYYSLPLLKDIHSTDIYQHYVLLVESVFLLLQDSISSNDISKAEDMLIHFCCMFAAFYGERYMTCNIHQLLHLPDMVRTMGPLWAYSCFSFENANGVLLKLFHGTQNVDLQIAQSISIIQKLPILQCKYLEKDTAEWELYQSMRSSMLPANEVHLGSNIYAVGVGKERILQEFQMKTVIAYLGYMPVDYISFSRLRIGYEIFHSRSYLRSIVRNSYTITYRTSCGKNCVGQVEFYLQIRSNSSVVPSGSYKPVNIALVSPLECDNSEDNKLSHDPLTSACVRYIHVLKPLEQYKVEVIPVESIIHKCVFIELCDKPGVVYACALANHAEKE